MRIIVYVKPNCVMCKYTKSELDKLELQYETIDVTLDRAAERDVRKMIIDGRPVMELPVVIVSSNSRGTQRWAGLKVDRLRALKHGVVVPQSNAEPRNG